MAYVNDSKPMGSFTNDTKPTLGSLTTWASVLTTWATEINTWASISSGVSYTNDSKPS